MNFWEMIVIIVLKWLLGQDDTEAEKLGEKLNAVQKGYNKRQPE